MPPRGRKYLIMRRDQKSRAFAEWRIIKRVVGQFERAVYHRERQRRLDRALGDERWEYQVTEVESGNRR